MKSQILINSILSLLMALMPSAGFCQSSDRNYVRTQTMLNGQGTKIKTEIQYYDALGRPDLSGDYEIELVMGYWVFTGFISLF